MRRLRGGQVWRLPQAGRAFVHRFGFVILLTAAFTLMVLGRAEMAAVERLRTTVTDLVANSVSDRRVAMPTITRKTQAFFRLATIGPATDL